MVFNLKVICDTNQCKNNGTCIKNSSVDVGYSCQCKNGYSGPICDAKS